MDDCIIECYVKSTCKALHLPQVIGSSDFKCQLFAAFDLFSDVEQSTEWDMFEKKK